MNRLFIILLSLLWLNTALPAQKKPNILIIETDDLGFHDLSCTGSKIYQTPNIDLLAQKSLTFEQAYTNYPRCTPSRYALMTGTYPVNEDHGHIAGIPSERSFFKIFMEAGYKTSYVGKWHLGDGVNSPKGLGLHHTFAAGEAGATAQQFYPFNNPAKANNEKPMEDVEAAGKKGDYLTDLLTEQTMQFIKGNGKKQPFLAVLAFYAVHTPLEAKKEDYDRNKKEIDAFDYGNTPEYIPEGTGRRKMRQDNPDYAGMVECVDQNVGKLLALLKEMGIDDNTIIVFTSDHGGLSNDGEKKRILATTNHPLRAGKGHLYEGGIRVPFILYWGKKIKPSVDRENILMGMDVFPTLIDMALGKKVEHIDGKSYLPVLNGKENWKDRPVFWHEDKARPHSTGDTKCSAVRQGDYKLLHFYKEDRFELYNVRTDISEEHNLINEQPELAARMMDMLSNWKKQYLVPEKLNLIDRSEKKAAKEEKANKPAKDKTAKKKKNKTNNKE